MQFQICQSRFLDAHVLLCSVSARICLTLPRLLRHGAFQLDSPWMTAWLVVSIVHHPFLRFISRPVARRHCPNRLARTPLLRSYSDSFDGCVLSIQSGFSWARCRALNFMVSLWVSLETKPSKPKRVPSKRTCSTYLHMHAHMHTHTCIAHVL